jgi:outer membrane lipoprotein-sorting protein
MRKQLLALSAAVMALVCAAAEPSPEEILRKVSEKYKSLESYSDEGTVVSDSVSDTRNFSFSKTFSLKLKKPSLYLIEWSGGTGGFTQSGAVWNNNDQPWLYMGAGNIMNSCAKIKDDSMALAAATGVSGGSAHTVPERFFDFMNGFSLSLKNAKLEESEPVDGEDCYVISSDRVCKETWWISKSRFLMLKRRTVSDTADRKPVPELSDAQLEAALKMSGQAVTEESMKRMRDMLKKAGEASAKAGKSIITTTETHSNIKAPDPSLKDFNYKLPEGTVVKDNLFDMANPQAPAAK